MPESRQQVRAAHAVMSGHSNIMPKSIAAEIIDKMHNRKMASLPERGHSVLPKHIRKPSR